MARHRALPDEGDRASTWQPTPRCEASWRTLWRPFATPPPDYLEVATDLSRLRRPALAGGRITMGVLLVRRRSRQGPGEDFARGIGRMPPGAGVTAPKATGAFKETFASLEASFVVDAAEALACAVSSALGVWSSFCAGAAADPATGPLGSLSAGAPAHLPRAEAGAPRIAALPLPGSRLRQGSIRLLA